MFLCGTSSRLCWYQENGGRDKTPADPDQWRNTLSRHHRHVSREHFCTLIVIRIGLVKNEWPSVCQYVFLLRKACFKCFVLNKRLISFYLPTILMRIIEFKTCIMSCRKYFIIRNSGFYLKVFFIHLYMILCVKRILIHLFCRDLKDNHSHTINPSKRNALEKSKKRDSNGRGVPVDELEDVHAALSNQQNVHHVYM